MTLQLSRNQLALRQQNLLIQILSVSNHEAWFVGLSELLMKISVSSLQSVSMKIWTRSSSGNFPLRVPKFKTIGSSLRNVYACGPGRTPGLLPGVGEKECEAKDPWPWNWVSFTKGFWMLEGTVLLFGSVLVDLFLSSCMVCMCCYFCLGSSSRWGIALSMDCWGSSSIASWQSQRCCLLAPAHVEKKRKGCPSRGCWCWS